jgi:ribosome-binding protein aMBF1 (putative translation factor)
MPDDDSTVHSGHLGMPGAAGLVVAVGAGSMTGRRNCARCTRWRHDVDFRWRWRKQRKVRGRGVRPRAQRATVDNVCNHCRRVEEQYRYHHMTQEEKQARIKRMNAAKKKRIAKLEEQVRQLRKANPRWGANRVDLVPFRMWLLSKARENGGVSTLAQEIGCDEHNVRRWLHGYDWDSEPGPDRYRCEPRPIYSINTGTVDSIGVALGEPDLLDRLYPYAVED